MTRYTSESDKNRKNPSEGTASCLYTDRIDPGSYDSTLWNRTPIRLIQTNLPEIEGSMDRDEYVQSILDASANAVLFNTGGIVSNYQTKLQYQWKNPNIGDGDLVADLINILQEKGIRYIARFDFSKLESTIAFRRPDWLYVETNGQPQIFNGLYSACIKGGYYSSSAATSILLFFWPAAITFTNSFACLFI